MLEGLARHRRFMEVYDDLLTIQLCCLAMQTEEELYLETIARYDQQVVREEWPAVIGYLWRLYQYHLERGDGWYDPLGMIFEEYTSRRGASQMGQFFTPPGVCDLMASIAATSHSGTWVNDPSAGSGRNLLAHIGLDPAHRLQCRYLGQDLDRMCVKMTALNLAMHGMSGYSIHCNTLTLEVFGGWRVYLAETGLGVRKLSVEQARAMVVPCTPATDPDTANEIAPTPSGEAAAELQLQLF
jgi:type I restriction enzyme M protein